MFVSFIVKVLVVCWWVFMFGLRFVVFVVLSFMLCVFVVVRVFFVCLLI